MEILKKILFEEIPWKKFDSKKYQVKANHII
jgi:hypothetical protein